MSEDKNKQNDTPEQPEESALARRLRSLDGEETLREVPDEILFRPKTFREKLANYWYHFKWPTILVACIGSAFLICVMQLAGRIEPDLYLMYAGPASLSASGIEAVQQSFETFDDDYNGDGKHTASLLDLVVYTDPQMAELGAQAAAKGEDLRFNSTLIAEARQRFSNEITVGDTVICLLDPHMYQSVYDAGGFLPLSEVFDALPDGVTTVDDCGILLSSTEFGRNFAGVNELPDDTILCLRRVSTMGTFKNKERTEQIHAYHLSVFRKLVSYTSSATGTET